MPHCNDAPCTKSTRYDGDDRRCDCACETCAANATKPTKKARAAAGACEACGARIQPADEFCDACGEAISEETRTRAYGRVNDEIYDRNVEANRAR